MRISGLPFTGLISLTLLLMAPAARAQEMGLDLSGTDTSQSESTENPETPAGGDEKAGTVGLDLSGETTGSELLPHVVVVGLDTPERAGAAVGGRWLKDLFVAAQSNEQWVLTTPPKEVREKLGDGYTTALQCAEASCLAEPADTLEADLLVTSRLALEDEGWTFRLWIFDRDYNKVETDSVTGRSPKDAKFQKAAADLLSQQLGKLARKRATLSVTVNVPQAVVRLGERTLGVGSLERNLAPGQADLSVEADGFTSYKKPVTLKPGEKSSVKVYLELTDTTADGPPSEVASEALGTTKSGTSGPTLLTRPALYTAVVGALAMGAGVVVGMQAKKIANRAPDTDGNGVANITRQERLDAQHQANLSTALVAGGAGVVGASVVWLAIMPTRSEAPKAAPSVAPGAASGKTSSTGLHFLLGGSF